MILLLTRILVSIFMILIISVEHEQRVFFININVQARNQKLLQPDCDCYELRGQVILFFHLKQKLDTMLEHTE